MDRLTIIVAMTGMGFTVLGVAMWRLHVLLEEAYGRIDALERYVDGFVDDQADLMAMISPKSGPSIVEDPAEWGC